MSLGKQLFKAVQFDTCKYTLSVKHVHSNIDLTTMILPTLFNPLLRRRFCLLSLFTSNSVKINLAAKWLNVFRKQNFNNFFKSIDRKKTETRNELNMGHTNAFDV